MLITLVMGSPLPQSSGLTGDIQSRPAMRSILQSVTCIAIGPAMPMPRRIVTRYRMFERPGADTRLPRRFTPRWSARMSMVITRHRARHVAECLAKHSPKRMTSRMCRHCVMRIHTTTSRRAAHRIRPPLPFVIAHRNHTHLSNRVARCAAVLPSMYLCRPHVCLTYMRWETGYGTWNIIRGATRGVTPWASCVGRPLRKGEQR
jgi:hypothetical protein